VGFTEAVEKALALDRRGVRDRAAERFSAERMARQYLEVYRQVATGSVGRISNLSHDPGHPHFPSARRTFVGSSSETDKLS
jgi:hypothetical protein